MTNNQISNLKSIGNAISSAGLQYGNAYYNNHVTQNEKRQAEAQKLADENASLIKQNRDNKVNGNVKGAYQLVFGDNGYLQTMANNAKTNNSLYTLSQDYSDKFESWKDPDTFFSDIGMSTDDMDDEMKSAVYEKFMTNYRPLYEATAYTYAGESARISMTEDLIKNAGVAISEPNEDGTSIYDGTPGEIATRVKDRWDSSTSDFEGFDLINKNGNLSRDGATAIEAQAKYGSYGYAENLINTNSKLGPMYTYTMLEKDIDNFAPQYLDSIGYTNKAEQKELIDKLKDDAIKSLEAKKKILKQDASDAQDACEIAIADLVMNDDAINTISDVSIEQLTQIFEENGLSDSSNQYVKSARKNIFQLIYKANITEEESLVAEAISEFESGELGVDFTIEDIEKAYNTGMLTESTTYSIDDGKETVTTEESDNPKIDSIASELQAFSYAMDYQEASEYGSVDASGKTNYYAVSRSTFVGKYADAICEKKGITDSRQKQLIVQALESRLSASKKNGTLFNLTSMIDEQLKDKNVTPAQFKINLDKLVANGWITQGTADSYMASKSWTNTDAYNTLRAELSERIPSLYSQIDGLSATRSYLQLLYQEYEKDGKVSDADMSAMVTTAIGHFMDEFSDKLNIETFGTAMYKIFKNDEFKAGIVENLGPFNVDKVMEEYATGAYKELGIDEAVHAQMKSLMANNSKNITKKTVLTMCENAWKMMFGDTEGKYESDPKKQVGKDGNKDWRYEACERAALIACASYIQDKNLQYQCGDLLDYNGENARSVYFVNPEENFGAMARVSRSGVIVVPAKSVGGIGGEDGISYKVAHVNKDVVDRVYGVDSVGYITMTPETFDNELDMIPDNEGIDLIPSDFFKPYTKGEMEYLTGSEILSYSPDEVSPFAFTYLDGKIRISKKKLFGSKILPEEDYGELPYHTQEIMKNGGIRITIGNMLKNLPEVKEFVKQYNGIGR